MTQPPMSNSIRPDIVARLIALGSDANIDRPIVKADYADLEQNDTINRLHRSAWNAVSASLSMDELVNLLKGLTIAEL